MQELDIPIHDWADTDRIARHVEAVIEKHELLLTMKGTLKRYPGCTHWHFKNGRLPGTLELTLWPEKRRLWINVQSGRAAPWIDELLPALRREFVL